MTRKLLLSGAALLVATAISPASSAIAQDFDWRSQEGKSINVSLSRHPWQEAIEPMIAEFEELTGIGVNLNTLPEQQYLTKTVADLTGGVFSQDVFMTQYYDASTYQANGWTANLGPYIEAADAAGYDWNDFFPAARYVADIGGQYIDRVAITSEAQVLVYRIDVLEELGLPVPTTFEELATTAEKISSETRYAGATLRGAASNWWPLYGVVKSFGGEYLELPDVTPVVNSPETVAALEMYARLAATAPRGVTSYDWDEINTAMLSGQATLFLDSSVIYARLQDPELSTVVDSVGIAPMVEGPAGPAGNSHFWTVSLSATAAEPDAGWLFIQWATSKEIQGRVALEGVLGARESSWQVEGLNEVFPQEFIDAVAKSLETAVVVPANPQFYELMDPLRAQVQEVVLGNVDAKTALNAVQAEWERIIK